MDVCYLHMKYFSCILQTIHHYLINNYYYGLLMNKKVLITQHADSHSQDDNGVLNVWFQTLMPVHPLQRILKNRKTWSNGQEGKAIINGKTKTWTELINQDVYPKMHSRLNTKKDVIGREHGRASFRSQTDWDTNYNSATYWQPKRKGEFPSLCFFIRKMG